jgi:hypothetical protein
MSRTQFQVITGNLFTDIWQGIQGLQDITNSNLDMLNKISILIHIYNDKILKSIKR